MDRIVRPTLAEMAEVMLNLGERAAQVLPEDAREAALAAKPFHALEVGDWLVARTGYTGEDGWEITLPGDAAADAWRRLVEHGVRPCGLGARDTLRLEAGMNLYGTDMDETTSPLESGLDWTVAWEPAERSFIGRAALDAQREHGVPRKFVGLLLEGLGRLGVPKLLWPLVMAFNFILETVALLAKPLSLSLRLLLMVLDEASCLSKSLV